MKILILLIVIGIVLLLEGAGWFVKGASALAHKLRASELAIGLTIVAFGTSLPELVVNCIGALGGNDGMVLGNVIGSNSFNLFIILGLAGLITPVKVKSGTAWREIPFSLLALVVLFVLINDQLLFGRNRSGLGRVEGMVMLLLFGLFLYYVIRWLGKEERPFQEPGRIISGWKTALLLIAGLAGLIIGGKLVLVNAVRLAKELNLSERIIGLTIVAAGTSLPELATTVVAAWKKNSDIAVGNVIGSNIFNILFILPVSSIIKPVGFDRGFNNDMYFLAGGTLLLLLAMYTGKRKRIDRWEALLLISAYVSYSVYLLQRTSP